MILGRGGASQRPDVSLELPLDWRVEDPRVSSTLCRRGGKPHTRRFVYSHRPPSLLSISSKTRTSDKCCPDGGVGMATSESSRGKISEPATLVQY